MNLGLFSSHLSIFKKQKYLTRLILQDSLHRHPIQDYSLWHPELVHCSIQKSFLINKTLKNNMVGFFSFYLLKLMVFYLFLQRMAIPLILF